MIELFLGINKGDTCKYVRGGTRSLFPYVSVCDRKIGVVLSHTLYGILTMLVAFYGFMVFYTLLVLSPIFFILRVELFKLC